MKQGIGLKAAVLAIQNRYKIKEGLARRLARAEVGVIKRTYSSLQEMPDDKVLEMRYAAASNAVNVLRDINVPALIFNIKDTQEANIYVATIREVAMVSPVTEQTSALEASLEKPTSGDIERLMAGYDKSAAREGRAPGTGGLFRIPEFREAFDLYKRGLIDEGKLQEIAASNEEVKRRILTGDYGEETEEMELAAGEPYMPPPDRSTIRRIQA